MSTMPMAMPLRERAAVRVRPELPVLLFLAAALNLWALSRNGMANDYYAAAVRSMSTSWHAFLYGSFDVSGVQTVDKPPLALWVQALSVRVFGFHSLAMLVPQALMGMGAVALVYDLVRRPFGRAAGFAGGLALALTPITVAISRHNNPDALLVLCATAALWFLVRGLEDGRTKWLVWCGVMIGLGFETKMAAALIVVPGLALAWLWVAPRGYLAALKQLALGGLALVAVGGAWPLLMALTPASSRPYISGTSDNSIWSLIVGYNGLGRVDGQAGGAGGHGGRAGGWRRWRRQHVRRTDRAAAAASRRASGRRRAGWSASRSCPASASRCSRACAAPTRAPAGSSRPAARSRPARSPSATRAASSIPTTSRCWRRSRRP